jgi:hypothetical protein
MTETEGSRTGRTHGGLDARAFCRPIIPILQATKYHTLPSMANIEWDFSEDSDAAQGWPELPTPDSGGSLHVPTALMSRFAGWLFVSF